MKLSPLALAILEFAEELKLVAYQDQHGVWTCGYGHTGPDVVQGTTCTMDGAAAWLAHDVAHAEDAVTHTVKVPLSQRQFDAFVLLTYNIGAAAFAGSSLLRLFHGGNTSAAANEFLVWNHVQGAPNTGLTRRRRLERSLFLDNSEFLP